MGTGFTYRQCPSTRRPLSWMSLGQQLLTSLSISCELLDVRAHSGVACASLWHEYSTPGDRKWPFSQGQPHTRCSLLACVGFSVWLPGRLRKQAGLITSLVSSFWERSTLKSFLSQELMPSRLSLHVWQDSRYSSEPFSASAGRPEWSGLKDAQQGPLSAWPQL